MRNAPILVIILTIFGLMNIATKKNMPYPCESQINYFLYSDTISNGYYFTTSHDTVVIKANKDTLWDSKTLAVCKLLNDTCKINNYKILVVDTTIDQSKWTTPYGKQIFFRQCQ